MYVSLIGPEQQGDRIHLWPEAAAADLLASGRTLFRVDVALEPENRRVVAIWFDPQVIDACWSTPAQMHADGSITVKGPIPEALFDAHWSARRSQPDPDHQPTARRFGQGTRGAR